MRTKRIYEILKPNRTGCPKMPMGLLPCSEILAAPMIIHMPRVFIVSLKERWARVVLSNRTTFITHWKSQIVLGKRRQVKMKRDFL